MIVMTGVTVHDYPFATRLHVAAADKSAGLLFMTRGAGCWWEVYFMGNVLIEVKFFDVRMAVHTGDFICMVHGIIELFLVNKELHTHVAFVDVFCSGSVKALISMAFHTLGIFHGQTVVNVHKTKEGDE
jgi:hypothetical protein